MSTTDVTFDEDFGNTPTPECHFSIARSDDLFVATEHIIPWGTPEDGDNTRAICPTISLERGLRKAPVPDPTAIRQTRFLTNCLSADYVSGAYSALKDNGLLEDPEDEDPDAIYVFPDYYTFIKRCDKTMEAAKDEPAVQVDQDSWDTFEDFRAGGAGRWLYDQRLQQLTEITFDLTLYVAASEICGPRALAADRDHHESQLSMVAGRTAADRGQLAETMVHYYFKEQGGAVGHGFITPRLAEFLHETQYDDLWEVVSHDPTFYAIHLGDRGQLETASRARGMQIVRPRIVHALPRMAPLDLLLADVADQPAVLVREVQTLGEAVLGGQRKEQSPFSAMQAILDYLNDDRHRFADFISAKRQAGMGSADLVRDLTRAVAAQVRGEEKDADDDLRSHADFEHIAPPKPGQVKKALRGPAYIELESTYFKKLQSGVITPAEVCTMMTDCFEAETVLTNAVLLAAPAAKLSLYTKDSDFLALLKDYARLDLYMAQTLLYDTEEEEVPVARRDVTWDKGQVDLLRQGKWSPKGGLDPLNHVILFVRGHEAGTKFAKHDTARLYRDGELLRQLIEHNSKVYGAIGYPPSISKAAGVTYSGFIGKLQRLLTRALALESGTSGEPGPREKMLKQIDDFAEEGHVIAAAGYMRTVYGACPDERKLGAWIEAAEPILARMDTLLTALKTHVKIHEESMGVFAKERKAEMLPGFEKGPGKATLVSGGGDGTTGGGGGDKGRGKGKGDKKKEKGKGKDAGKDQEQSMSPAKAMAMGKDARVDLNFKCVYYFQNETHQCSDFTKMGWYFKWGEICSHLGWDKHKVCGPCALSKNVGKNDRLDCQDKSHTVRADNAGWLPLTNAGVAPSNKRWGGSL